VKCGGEGREGNRKGRRVIVGVEVEGGGVEEEGERGGGIWGG